MSRCCLWSLATLGVIGLLVVAVIFGRRQCDREAGVHPGAEPFSAPAIPRSAALESGIGQAGKDAVQAPTPMAALPLVEMKAEPPDLRETPSEIRLRIEHFGDTAVPVAQRLRELEQLGTKGDEESVSVLKAVGDAETYLNYAAIEALGRARLPGVTEYLAEKLSNPDSRVVCAAVKSLATLEGAKAVSKIGVTLKANRSRSDGHQDLVCGTCVEALGAIGVPAAIPLLGAELKETRGVTLSYTYGSQVVAALKKIGDPAGRPVLLEYADQLAVEAKSKPPDPMVQEYLQGLIREARNAAETLGR